jgi:hypothetical protein
MLLQFFMCCVNPRDKKDFLQKSHFDNDDMMMLM